MEVLGSGVPSAGTEAVSGTGAEKASSRSVIGRIIGSRPTSPAFQGLVAFLVYLAVFVFAFAWPLIREFGTPAVAQKSQDPNFYIWCWQWWPYALTHGLNPLYSSQIGAPVGLNLAWTTPAAPVALVMSPVTAAFGPVVSFNLSLILLLPLSGWAAFLAVRRLTGRFWASLLGGAVFSFNPYEVGHTLAGQVNLTALFLLPLMLYLVLLWRDGTLGRVGFVLWLGVAMALELYTFTEAFLMMTVMWAATLVVGLLITHGDGRRTVARLTGLAALAYGIAIVLASPLLYYMMRHSAGTFSHQNPLYDVRPIGLVLPQPVQAPAQWLATLGMRDMTGYSHTAYVGIPALVLIVAWVVLDRHRNFTWLVAIMFTVAALLSFGPSAGYGTVHYQGQTVSSKAIPLPWGPLWSLPFARSAEPTRIILFGYLALGIAVALWLAVPVSSRLARVGRWSLAVIAVGAILADLTTFTSVMNEKPAIDSTAAVVPAGDRMPGFISDELYRQYLKPGETVVVVSDRGNAGMLFQSAADFYFRLDGGFINASLKSPDTPAAVVDLKQPTRVRKQAFRSYVRKNHVGAILVEQAWAEPWTKRAFDDAGLHGTPAGGVTVYPIR